MDKDTLEKIFYELDVGGDGSINKEELAKLCDYFGMDAMSPAELNKLYKNLDTDHDGLISKDEFFHGLFVKDFPTSPDETGVEPVSSGNKKTNKSDIKGKESESINKKDEYIPKVLYSDEEADLTPRKDDNSKGTKTTNGQKSTNSKNPSSKVALITKSSEGTGEVKQQETEPLNPRTLISLAKQKQPGNTDINTNSIKPKLNNIEVKEESRREKNQEIVEGSGKSKLPSIQNPLSKPARMADVKGATKDSLSFLKSSPSDVTPSKTGDDKTKDAGDKDSKLPSSSTQKSLPKENSSSVQQPSGGTKGDSSFLPFLKPQSETTPDNATTKTPSKAPTPTKTAPTKDSSSRFSFLKRSPSQASPPPQDAASKTTPKATPTGNKDDSSMFSFLKSEKTPVATPTDKPKDALSAKTSPANSKRKSSVFSFMKKSPSETDGTKAPAVTTPSKTTPTDKGDFFSFLKSSPSEVTPTKEANKDDENPAKKTTDTLSTKDASAGGRRKSSIFSFMKQSPSDETKTPSKTTPKPTPKATPNENKDGSSMFSFLKSSPSDKTSSKDASKNLSVADPAAGTRRKSSIFSFMKQSPSETTPTKDASKDAKADESQKATPTENKDGFFSFLKEPDDKSPGKTPVKDVPNVVIERVKVSSPNAPPSETTTKKTTDTLSTKDASAGGRRKSSIFSFMKQSPSDEIKTTPSKTTPSKTTPSKTTPSKTTKKDSIGKAPEEENDGDSSMFSFLRRPSSISVKEKEGDAKTPVKDSLLEDEKEEKKIKEKETDKTKKTLDTKNSPAENLEPAKSNTSDKKEITKDLVADLPGNNTAKMSDELPLVKDPKTSMREPIADVVFPPKETKSAISGLKDVSTDDLASQKTRKKENEPKRSELNNDGLADEKVEDASEKPDQLTELPTSTKDAVKNPSESTPTPTKPSSLALTNTFKPATPPDVTHEKSTTKSPRTTAAEKLPSSKKSNQVAVEPTQPGFNNPPTARTEVTEPKLQPTVQTPTQPDTYPAAQPTAKIPVQPTTQPTTQPATQPTTQPATQPSAQPTAQPTTQPATQPTTQPNTKQTPTDTDSLKLFDDPKFRPDPAIWLDYLDEERTGKVDSSALIEFWDDLGVPDGKEILKKLNFPTDGEVDIGALTSALERELKEQSGRNPRLHQVAVATLLHSADKLQKDNEFVVEECGRMGQEMEALKVDLKRADEVMQAYEEEKEEDVRILQAENQKMKVENEEMTAKLQQLTQQINLKQSQQQQQQPKQQETQQQSTQTQPLQPPQHDQEIKELKVLNADLEEELKGWKNKISTLQSEITTLQNNIKESKAAPASSSSPSAAPPSSSSPSATAASSSGAGATKEPLKKDEYASFDFSDNDSPSEIRRKVREEFERREMLMNEERKTREGLMMMEVAEVEKRSEVQVEKMKLQQEAQLTEMRSTFERELQNKMAEKEKQLMMDIVADKMMKKEKEGESEEEVKVRQLEKELNLKNAQLTEVSEELEKQAKTMDDLKKQLASHQEGVVKADRGMFEEYEPAADAVGRVEMEEKLRRMEDEYEDRIGKLKSDYEKLSRKWDEEEGKDEVVKVKKECEEEMVRMKKRCDEEVMEGVNKLNDLEAKLTALKSQLNAKDAAVERLRREMNEVEEKLSREVDDKDAMVRKLQGHWKESKLESAGLQERLQQQKREYEEVVEELESQLKRKEDDAVSLTSRRLEQLDAEISAKDDEILKLKESIRELEKKRLASLTASKQAEDDLKQVLASMKAQHEDERAMLKRQLRQQQPVSEGVLVSSRSDLASKNVPVDAPDEAEQLKTLYESKISELTKKSEKEKEALVKEKEEQMDRLRSDHDTAMNALKRARERRELDREVESKREAAEMIDDMRLRHERRLKEVSTATNKQLDDNLREFSEQVAELKKSFGKMSRAKDEEVEGVRREREALQVEVDELRKLLLEANNKPPPEALVIDRTDILSERDLLKDQLRQTLKQLNDVTTALTLLTNQHRADKKAWKQAGEKMVDAGKYQELSNKMAATEVTNQRLQTLLEKNQSEVARMLIANRETFDKELWRLKQEKDSSVGHLEKVKAILAQKNEAVKAFEDQQHKADVLTKDLYAENARILKYLQTVEKQRSEANGKIASLEQKVLCMGELIRSLCPVAIS